MLRLGGGGEGARSCVLGPLNGVETGMFVVIVSMREVMGYRW